MNGAANAQFHLSHTHTHTEVQCEVTVKLIVQHVILQKVYDKC